MSQENYIYTIDPYPLQSADFNRVHPFFDALKEGRFVNSRCQDCGQMFWPPRFICPNCMSDNMQWEDLPKEGTVVAFSVQESGVPLGFKPPLIFAIIELDNGLRLFSRIAGADPKDVEIGKRVQFQVEPIPNDPFERVLFSFRLV